MPETPFIRITFSAPADIVLFLRRRIPHSRHPLNERGLRMHLLYHIHIGLDVR
jgi:hypothetical protein